MPAPIDTTASITTVSSSRTTSAQDAMGRYATAKFPVIDASITNVHQLLANNVAITTNQADLVTKNMGNPTTVRLFITVSAACNFQVWVGNSSNPGKLYHDTSLDITIGSAGDKIVDIKGGGYVKLIPSANVTATIEVLALY